MKLFDHASGEAKEIFSRRSLMIGAASGAVGVTGLTIAGSQLLFAKDAHASGGCGPTPIQDILNIAATAERLAVTFYSHGVLNASKLGISSDDVAYLKAALVEEQIHELYFESAGAYPLTSEFSFPHGAETFESLEVFVNTQQELEGFFDSAFLAAVKEFSEQSRSDLAQVAAQIACIEAEHRVLGRVIGNLMPANNWAYMPVRIGRVADTPAHVQKAGYLSPNENNKYTYHQANISDMRIQYRTPFAVAACV
jgi:hypothetical protein